MPPPDASFPAVLPPDGSPIRREVPRLRLGTRLHFVWFVVWGTLWTLMLSPFLLVDSTFRPGARTFKRWMTRWARMILGGTGVRVRTELQQPLDPARPVVLVANHQNALDILTASAAIPHPFGFAAKAELRRVPIVGTVLAHTACVFVDRSTPRRAAQTLAEAGAQIRAGNSVLVFPEGLRTWRTTVAPFARGAFLLALEAGAPLVPVAIDGDVGLFDERHGASRPGLVRVAIGPPVPTAGRPRDDVPALMEAVRAWMARELGVVEEE